jgi:hypothetical protein
MVYIEQCCPSLNHFSKSDTQGTMRHSVHGRWCSTKNVCLWRDPITMGNAMGSWLRGLEPLFYLELPFLSRSMQRVQSKVPLCFHQDNIWPLLNFNDSCNWLCYYSTSVCCVLYRFWYTVWNIRLSVALSFSCSGFSASSGFLPISGTRFHLLIFLLKE